MNIRITIFKGNQIIACCLFSARSEADLFRAGFTAIEKPFKTVPGQITYTMGGFMADKLN